MTDRELGNVFEYVAGLERTHEARTSRFRIDTEPIIKAAMAAFQEGDLLGSLRRFNRIFSPDLIDLWWGEMGGLHITKEQLRTVILQAWSNSEFPCRILRPKRWVELFEAVGFVSDVPGMSAPQEPLEVWRSQVGRVYGLSWTTSEERASWFHERNCNYFHSKDRSRLLHVFAKPTDVLAFIDETEGEVVLHPRAAPAAGLR